ncbi:MAG: replicative DNA helicase [Planctomycetes bacterium]|nr:replicative DNA helicase [Planctomycetota bacterium]
MSTVAVTSEILDRQPPFNLEAEIGVLGSIMLLPDVCDEVALILRPEDFYDDANCKLFEHMGAMHDAGKKIDITLLVNRLKSEGDFEAIGGAAYLAQVSNAVPNPAHAIYYANIVREKSTYRALINASTEILRDAYDEAHDAKELLSQAEQRVFAILDNRGNTEISTIKDILHEAMDRIDAMMRGEHTTGSVETGFADLDSLTGGLHNSELIILAARPSMGKTALAMNIAEHVSVAFGVPTLFVSLEMSSVELADRLLCSVARVNGHRLRNGTLSQQDRRRLVEKAAEVSRAPLFVDDSPSRTVTEIAAAARRVRRREGNLGLVIVDYLQLIEPDNPKDPRQEQVAKITRRLKGMARELQVPVLCLAQVSRQAEDSKFHRPRLSHLRESGAIEQDADVVIMLSRPPIHEQEARPNVIHVTLAKQRNGPTGKLELAFDRNLQRFRNIAEGSVGPPPYEEPPPYEQQPPYEQAEDEVPF